MYSSEFQSTKILKIKNNIIFFNDFNYIMNSSHITFINEKYINKNKIFYMIKTSIYNN